MIVREIKADPDGVLATFDWFNDYKDTRSWLLGGLQFGLLEMLDKGHEKWLVRLRKARPS